MKSPPDRPHHNRLGVSLALAAALLFGASTPFAKLLVGQMPALWLASSLYLGSAVALTVWIALRGARRRVRFGLARGDWGWLAAATFAGGVLGPVLLLTGLATTPANTASLLLNLESVFTAVLAWIVFREHTDRRLVLGMLLIVAGGVALTWSATIEHGSLWPARRAPARTSRPRRSSARSPRCRFWANRSRRSPGSRPR